MTITNEIVNYKGLNIYRQEAEVIKRIHLYIERELKIEDNHVIELDIRWGHDVQIKEDFCHLTHLKKLVINNCRNNFPINIFDIFSLRILSLINCQLQEDDLELIHNLTNLTSLKLNNTYIKEIPKNILKLKKLESLSIDSCRLEQLPQEIGDLSNLCELSLQANLIKTIPKSLFTLRKLQKLDFYGNQITIIPKEIGFLIDLEYVNFWGNKVKELPKSICNLTNLNDLNLSGNDFSELPDCLARLLKLEHLDINMSSLKTLPLSLLEKVDNYRMDNSRLILYAERLDKYQEFVIYLNKENKSLQEQIYQFMGLKKQIDFDDPNDFLYFVESLLNMSPPEDFIKYLDGLDPDMVKKLPKRPQQSNRENFIEYLLDFYDDLTRRRNYRNITDKFFKKELLGPYFIEYLNNNLIDPRGYVRLSVIETLDLLESMNEDIKHTLETQPHKLRMVYSASGLSNNIPLNLIYILEVLLKVFTIEEAIHHLEQFHLKALQGINHKKHENKGVRRIIFDIILDETSIIKSKERLSNSDYGRFIQKYANHFLDLLKEHFLIALDKYEKYYELSWMEVVLRTSEIMGEKAIKEIKNLVVSLNLDDQIPQINKYYKRCGYY